MAKKKKKEQPEEHENAERWLLTYADMITLLVAFFIMMYSMSVMNLSKFNKAAIAIRSGFMGDYTGRGMQQPTKGSQAGSDKKPLIPGKMSYHQTGHGNEDRDPSLQQIVGMKSYVRDQLAVLKMEDIVHPVLDVANNQGNRFTVIIADQKSFAPRFVELTADNKAAITEAGNAIKSTKFKILIEGYSSPVSEEDKDEYQDSWQVSAERVRRVAAMLVDEFQINPRRLSLISYGEWKQPGGTKRLSLSPNGEWAQIDANTDKIPQDCVVISIMLD